MMLHVYDIVLWLLVAPLPGKGADEPPRTDPTAQGAGQETPQAKSAVARVGVEGGIAPGHHLGVSLGAGLGFSSIPVRPDPEEPDFNPMNGGFGPVVRFDVAPLRWEGTSATALLNINVSPQLGIGRSFPEPGRNSVPLGGRTLRIPTTVDLCLGGPRWWMACARYGHSYYLLTRPALLEGDRSFITGYSAHQLGFGGIVCLEESCVGTDHIELGFHAAWQATTLPSGRAAAYGRVWNPVLRLDARYVNEPFLGWLGIEAHLPSEVPGKTSAVAFTQDYRAAFFVVVGGSFFFTRSF